MAEIKCITENDFHSVVEMSKKPVLVDFFAVWCSPCQMVAPELEKLAAENEDLLVVKVNVDENNNLAEKFSVSSIPCMILFKDGEPKQKVIGYRSKQQLQSLLV